MRHRPARGIRRWSLVGAAVLICLGSSGPAPAAPADTVAATPARERPVGHRRGPTRLRVYRSFPGPNSVRQCEAHYVEEYRQAGTVIVPRVHCWWEG